MRRKVVYLTIEEKRELALQGKSVPICVDNSEDRNGFIAKIRGSIFDGSLKGKRIKL